MNFSDFLNRLANQFELPLPGHAAQYKMAPDLRMPASEWERYYPNARKGSVLILFYPENSSIHTVLIQRPTYDGVHSGQVAFPGGEQEAVDADFKDTALREAQEEVGIEKHQVRIVGRLTELYVPPSNFLITPVVGYATTRPNFRLNFQEVVELIEPALEELLDEKACERKSIFIRDNITIEAPCLNLRGKTVWGATAMIISELNEILGKTV